MPNIYRRKPPSPLDAHRVRVGSAVAVWANSVLGTISAVVVRDMTGDGSATQAANPMPGESVYEIRFTGGPHPGIHSFVPARSLHAIGRGRTTSPN